MQKIVATKVVQVTALCLSNETRKFIKIYRLL